ncbi:MAG: hypothetical protein ABIQ86_15205 [Steroidobacteraceae bacterium]
MKALYSIALIGALAAGEANGACAYPNPPDSFPNGATATRDEMLAGKKKVVDFDGLINAYLDCLKLETDAAIVKSAELTAAQKKQNEAIQKMADQKHNAAVEADAAVAARYNEQTRAYNARQKAAKDKK